MKSLLISCTLIISIFAMVACESSITTVPPSPTPDDYLSQLIDANASATSAAFRSQSFVVKGTTIAQATAESRIVHAQETRLIQDEIDRKTVFAQKVAGTETTAADNRTRYAVEQTKTQEAANDARNATARADLKTVTTMNDQRTATVQSVTATASAVAVLAVQTQASASATATAIEASARSTSAAARATAVTTEEKNKTEAEKQDWERKTESFRAVAMMLTIIVASLGGVVLVGVLAFLVVTRLLDRRVREYRDGDGALVIETPNGSWVRPGRMAGAFLPTRPGLALPEGSLDPDVTRREQAIAFARAGGDVSGIEDGPSDEPAQALTDGMAKPPEITITNPFESRPLDLTHQPTRLSLPIGVTATGKEMWIGLNEFTHSLAGGATQMGKTNLLHGWIRAMQNGNAVDLSVFDGKAGMSFARYSANPRILFVNDADLAPHLGNEIVEMQRRFALLREWGVEGIDAYNHARKGTDRLVRHVIVVDELFTALNQNGVEDALSEIVRKGGAAGIHLMMATQLVDSETVPRILRANTSLRVALPCVNNSDSQSILGASGADKIAKVQGRVLVLWQGSLIEAQAFLSNSETMALPMKEIASPKAAGLLNPFDDTTMRIVRYAVKNGKGLFVATELASKLEMRPAVVCDVARALEGQGFLSPVIKQGSDGRGGNAGRLITDKLKALVEQSQLDPDA
jgi:hypothetical protein